MLRRLRLLLLSRLNRRYLQLRQNLRQRLSLPKRHQRRLLNLLLLLPLPKSLRYRLLLQLLRL